MVKGKAKKVRPSGFRVPKITAKREGTYVPKPKGTGREGTGRREKKMVFVDDDIDDESVNDDEDLIAEEDESKMMMSWGFHSRALVDLPNKRGVFGGSEGFLHPRRLCLLVLKADNKRFTAACIMEACECRIHASRLTDKISWAIKTIKGEHTTCGMLEENPMVSSAWLCKKMLDVIKTTPDIPVESLQRVVQEKFRVTVKKRLFYKVKTMAKEEIYGGFAEAYSLLPTYAEMIKSTNPGSYALISWTGNTGQEAPTFKACIDGNNEIFLIAYGIVDTKSTKSWEYFFRNLRLCFEKEGCNKEDWCFISDRMRRVDVVVHGVFPKATRRVCCQHLYMNCKNMGWSGSAFHKLFWLQQMPTKICVQQSNGEDIAHDKDAAAYLDNTTEQWSRHMFDTTISCDHNTTNFVESFNACTKAHRDLPVLNLLQEWSMKRIGARFDKAIDMEPGHLTDYATKVLESRSGDSRFCHATSCGGGEFEVTDGNVTFPINLARLSCGCGKWQGCGIPCKHALRIMYNERVDPVAYVSDYYKGAAYKATYAEHIHPMPDQSQWPDFNLPLIHPPNKKRGAGRPPKQRKRGVNEAKKAKRHSSVK
ncbi:uncharacterized protein LOC104891528 [Beta vulgaris subsp. vulgaris]|uniref:uncharacterized protein LOC104891528 n=1 Tax=Beta vulgaris subsp. vulgaris TaxID=3555 RepID=UPI0025480E73|nr:uncharacterized protein LOC104891528 [Beta vulgaris subsp. vulgaris]